MNKLSYTQSHTNTIMKKVADILKWLESKDPNANKSRYFKYSKYINDFYKKQLPLNELEEKFTKLNWAFQELYEISIIYDSFKNENSDNFNSRIKKIISGQDLVPDVLTARNDSSRDFVYELLVASFFKSKGYTIDFNDLADVVAKRNKDILYIECKRLKSKNGLERNFKKAGNQLKNRTDKNVFGLIFIDIASCVLQEVTIYEYADIIQMNQSVNTAIAKYGQANNRLINQINDTYSNYSLAVCFTFFRCLWLRDLQINYYKDFKVIAPSTISDLNYEKLNEFLK